MSALEDTLIVRLVLPLPPSVNHIYQRTRYGGVMLTAKARAYYDTVTVELTKVATRPEVPEGKLALSVHAFVPVNRKRDGDNMLKLISDALAKCLDFNDDRIAEWYVLKHDIDKTSGKGMALVELRQFAENAPNMPKDALPRKETRQQPQRCLRGK